MDPDQIDADREAVAAFYGSRPLLYDSTRRSVSMSAWVYDMERIFYTCHIEDRLQVSLASRCLIADARLWWMTLGEPQMPSRTWAHFRAAVLARYGPFLVGGPSSDRQYRDPEIYRDMHHARYQHFVADWHAYPQESMGHYCRRFQEAMLPHVPQDLPHPELQALVILRNGVPPQIRHYVIEPTLEWTVGTMIDSILEAEIIAHTAQADAYMDQYQVPVDDAGQGDPMYEPGPMFPEDPIPVVPVQEIPAAEAEGHMGDEGHMGAEDDDDDDVVVLIDTPVTFFWPGIYGTMVKW